MLLWESMRRVMIVTTEMLMESLHGNSDIHPDHQQASCNLEGDERNAVND